MAKIHQPLVLTFNLSTMRVHRVTLFLSVPFKISFDSFYYILNTQHPIVKAFLTLALLQLQTLIPYLMLCTQYEYVVTHHFSLHDLSLLFISSLFTVFAFTSYILKYLLNILLIEWNEYYITNQPTDGSKSEQSIHIRFVLSSRHRPRDEVNLSFLSFNPLAPRFWIWAICLCGWKKPHNSLTFGSII